MEQPLFFKLLSVIVLYTLAACQPTAQTPVGALLKIGDKIDGMTLTNGAAQVPALWFFCASQAGGHITTADCRVPRLPALAIGDAFLATDEVLRETEWSDLTWELSFDGQVVDLDDFGTYDYVVPTMAPHPSPVREVFMRFTVWDVVLTDLKPGIHTLRGVVVANAEEYSWIVNISIE